MSLSNIDKIKRLRIFLLGQIEALTTEQLNHIPDGFNNNIIWNLGHLICVQQNMCYMRANLQAVVTEKHFLPYMPGTKSEHFIDEADISGIKETLITSMDHLQSDYVSNSFAHYSPSVMIPKVYGFEVTNIDEALAYLLYHEGVHAGYIAALKKLV